MMRMAVSNGSGITAYSTLHWKKPTRTMKKLVTICALCFAAPFLVSAQIDFSAREAAADRLRELELRHATVNDVDIAYRILGDTTDPAVMMIMGLGSSHVLWGYKLPSSTEANIGVARRR